MGTPTPPPPVIGDFLAFCDTILWPAGFTPLFIHVEFIGLIKCVLAGVDPPNAIWVLQQDPVDATKWVYEDALFYIAVFLRDPNTEMVCEGRGVAVNKHFFQAAGAGCRTTLTNILITCPPQNWSRHGTATLTWS